ncbi:DUF7666 domain-containing protein [Salmonella enterica]|uniref:DUF7666 domain-containing protein n=2 Tax=Salmonella enterica TaxID=28901 RepID=UPI000D769004|nr:hypothetical protein [Salmonella enterica]PXN21351.1 hypothetical protein A2H54_04235 [Salmonella enterica]
MTKEIVTFKGFNKDLTCRDFQFAIGETFHHDGKVEACGSGFHACECPFDVFSYYPPAESRYAETISFGVIDREEEGDTKIASASITINTPITIPQLNPKCIEGTVPNMTGNRSAATNTGNRSAATNTGYQSAATNTGYQSAATNTGYQSAATNTGDQSAATNTGCQSAAEVSGSQSVAASLGIKGKSRASEGGAIVLCYRDKNGELIHIRASKVGENGIMPNTWYQLNEDGEFVECE